MKELLYLISEPPLSYAIGFIWGIGISILGYLATYRYMKPKINVEYEKRKEDLRVVIVSNKSRHWNLYDVQVFVRLSIGRY